MASPEATANFVDVVWVANSACAFADSAYALRASACACVEDAAGWHLLMLNTL